MTGGFRRGGHVRLVLTVLTRPDGVATLGRPGCNPGATLAVLAFLHTVTGST